MLPAGPAQMLAAHFTPDDNITFATVTMQVPIKVTPAALAVTAANAARDYGLANPVFTGTLAGIRNNDLITAAYSTAATPSSPVGTYPIVPDLIDPQGKLVNYIVAKNNGTLTVRNVAPIVNAGSDQEKIAMDEVMFSGSFTDPSSPSHIVAWSFGDSTANVIGTLTPKHIYDKHGQYTVTLTVTDSHGASASDTLVVTAISSQGLLAETLESLTLVASQSKDLQKAVQSLQETFEARFWVDEMHLQPGTGDKLWKLWVNAVSGARVSHRSLARAFSSLFAVWFIRSTRGRDAARRPRSWNLRGRQPVSDSFPKRLIQSVHDGSHQRDHHQKLLRFGPLFARQLASSVQ